jgi:hypothetical protein
MDLVDQIHDKEALEKIQEYLNAKTLRKVLIHSIGNKKLNKIYEGELRSCVLFLIC